MKAVELRQATEKGPTRFLDARNLDPEDNLEVLDLGVAVVEDMIEVVVVVGMVNGGPCPVAADGVLQNHCRVKASGSTPGLAVAYLRLVEEDNCTT
jgi:hypothetical protein